MRSIHKFEDFVGEGRSAYDGLAGKLTKAVFNKWVKSYSGGNAVINHGDQIEERGLDSTGADGRDDDDEGDFQTPFINIDFGINPEWIPGEWSTVYFHLADVIRHEMEHITQDGKDHGNYRNNKPIEDDSELRAYIKMGLLPKSQYLMLPKEVDANLQGLRYEAKKRKEAMIDTVTRYLDTQEQGGVIDGTEREEVLTIWRRRAKEIGGIPNF